MYNFSAGIVLEHVQHFASLLVSNLSTHYFEELHVLFQISLGFQLLWGWYLVLHVQAHYIDFGYIID